MHLNFKDSETPNIQFDALNS